MYTSLDIGFLVHERNARVLREVRAERMGAFHKPRRIARLFELLSGTFPRNGKQTTVETA